jgi:uncharacterized FAD-dependent dehydrogenase
MKRRLLIGLALAWAAHVGAAQESISPEEMARIEQLCESVARSKDVQFVRNGKPHTPDDAAKFLREKLKAMGGEVRTAEEFIDKIATKSSMSGEPYTVRFADGREMPSAHFLRAELARQRRR